MDANYPQYSQLYGFDGFFAGDVKVPTQLLLPSPTLVGDYPFAAALLMDNVRSDGSDSAWEIDQFQKNDLYRMKEETFAGYAMLRFDNAHALPASLTGNVGLRVIDSKTSVYGHGHLRELNESEQTEYEEGEVEFADGEFFPLDGDNRYTNFLSSMSLNFSLAEGLMWRIALSRAIARTTFYQMRSCADITAETETISVDDGRTYTLVNRWIGRAGNPGLAPMKSDQFDTSLEREFSADGHVYTALFYKNLSDYILNQVENEPFSNNGQTRTVEVQRPRNIGRAKIQGFEFGCQHRYRFLPGPLKHLGLEGHFTLIDSQSRSAFTPSSPTEDTLLANLPLEGLSKNNARLAVIYRNQKVAVKLIYSWRDKFLQTTKDVSTQRPIWQAAHARLDASILLRISSALEVGIEATNLTNSTSHSTMGPHGYEDGTRDMREYDRRWSVTDRRITALLRGRF